MDVTCIHRRILCIMLSCYVGDIDLDVTPPLLCIPAFLIDAEISKGKTGRERELQAWRSSEDAHGSSSAAHNVPEGTGDEITFGAGAGANISWDQFATNEQMFGITTSFNEEVYTTRLDRNAPDFKEKERKAQRIASEIMGVS